MYAAKFLKMKKLLSLALFSLFLGFASTANAQEKVKKSVKKTAKTVGNKTAEVASKGKAVVTDQKHKTKVGPENQTIYIDNNSRYYWVDKKGRRHYVNESQLRARTKD